ncbi:hypothetical protein ABH942_002947 [Flavobacterium sp. 28YEA47A]
MYSIGDIVIVIISSFIGGGIGTYLYKNIFKMKK